MVSHLETILCFIEPKSGKAKTVINEGEIDERTTEVVEEIGLRIDGLVRVLGGSQMGLKGTLSTLTSTTHWQVALSLNCSKNLRVLKRV